MRPENRRMWATVLAALPLAVMLMAGPACVDAAVPRTKKIEVTAAPYHTGTVFSDYSGWGANPAYLLVGQNPDFDDKTAGGWMRFDISEIPDSAVIQKVYLTFSVFDDHGKGAIVDLTGLAEDPLDAIYHTRSYGLRNNPRYLTNVALTNGIWRSNLGSDAVGHLQKALAGNWFAAGLYYRDKPNFFVCIHGWEDDERPVLEVDYLVPEQILNAEWQKPFKIIEGDVVTMLAEVDGFLPDVVPTWEIWEHDAAGDDRIKNPEIKSHGVYEENGRYFVKGEWTARWHEDAHGDPEYFFIVTVGSASARSTEDKDKQLHVARGNDQQAPIPNPPAFATRPYAVSPTAVSMTVADVTDPEMYGVEYRFLCESDSGGCSNSEWSSSLTFMDADLSPGARYGYRVMTRDKSPNKNESEQSAIAYVDTFAAMPLAPIVKNPTPTSLDLEIREDRNSAATQYAVINVTENNYLSKSGRDISAQPIWRTRAEWGRITVSRLTPDTHYAFRIKARNAIATETTWGITGSGMTLSKTPDLYPENLGIRGSKRHLDTGGAVRIEVDVANHPTGGLASGPWQLQWILSGNRQVGDQDDVILHSQQYNETFAPGQKRHYTYDWSPDGHTRCIAVLVTGHASETNTSNNVVLLDLSQSLVKQ